MPDDGEQQHYLDPFLATTLPSLGLDHETYGNYITGLFPTDDADASAIIDEESMEEVMELLQQSSETHSEDEDAFEQLREELVRRQKDYVESVQVRKQEEKNAKEREMEEVRKREVQEAKELELELMRKKKELSENPDAEKDLAKLSLVEKYAFERDPDAPSSHGGKKSGRGSTHHADADDGGGGGNLNRAMAQEAAKEQGKQLRNKQSVGGSKKDAQKETKLQRIQKEKAKEERRKKATRGERKR